MNHPTHQTISRRSLLKGLGASAVVLGFDPVRRSWVSTAHAAACAPVPQLDGVLLTDEASRLEYANDFGHIVHRVPMAVLKPGSVEDVIRMVDYARCHGLRIGPRGQGHTTMGQSQVDAGIVVDMRTLNTIHSIGADQVVVDAGVTWSHLVTQTLAVGRTPPVLTGYVGLTVGGTLSVGGVNGMSFQHGAQVDNVLELQVVTGDGKLVTCSRSHKRKLFESVLGGLGQCGIIVRATIRLIPAKTHVRTFHLFYPDLPTMTADMRMLLKDRRFDFMVAYILPSPYGGWAYLLEVASYFTAPAEPDNAQLIAGLSYVPGSEGIFDWTYFNFVHRLEPQVAALKQSGQWELPHPWLDLFIPGSIVDTFVGNALAETTHQDLGPSWPILLFPFRREAMSQTMLRVPDEEFFFLFDILRTASNDLATRAGMLNKNRALFEGARAVGGKHYTIAAVPLTQEDWKQHYGPAWDDLVNVKRQHDPDNVLSPGPGIF